MPSNVVTGTPPRAPAWELVMPRAMRRAERRGRRAALGSVLALAAMSAVGAALASGAPTALPVVDVALRVALAVTVTLLAWRAPPVSVLAAASIALVASAPDPGLFVYAAGVFVAALRCASARPSARASVICAAVGAATVEVLLRLPAWGGRGTSALIASVAIGTIMVPAVVALDSRARRLVLAGLGAAGAITAVLTALLVASVLAHRADLDEGVTAAQAGFTAARAGDTAQAIAQLEIAQRRFETIDEALGQPWSRAARVLPIVGQQERALRALAHQATELARTGVMIAREANVDGLRIVNGRVDPRQVVSMHKPLVQASVALARAREALLAIRSPWLVGPLSDRAESLGRSVRDAARAVTTATLGVDASPQLLGATQPQRYFVMFTTPAELRASNGFMGNWGILTVAGGRFELSRFGRTAELNDAGDQASKHIDHPSDYVARYGRFHPAREWRNVNMSPDFPSVARAIEQLYPQSGGEPIDGVIAVDPAGLAQLLRLTGPVDVPGRDEPLTAGNAADFLLRGQYVAFGDSGDRIDFLDAAARAITQRLTTSSLPSASVVGRVLGNAARDGHLRAYSSDPLGQRLFRRIGVAGDLRRERGNVVGLVTQNASGNKIDVFLHRSLSVDATIDPRTDHLTGRAEIHLRNVAPTTGLPDYVIGNSTNDLPTGANKMYVSFYSRLGVTGATLDGRPVQLQAQRELGLNVYSVFVTVGAGADATLRLDLAGNAAFTKTTHGYEYRLHLWRQTTVNPDQIDVRIAMPGPWRLQTPARGFTVVNGRGQYAATLERDTDLRATISH